MPAWAAIAAKDLRQRFRDRSALIVAFLAPTVIAAIVTGAFGGGFGTDVSRLHVRVDLVDQDRSTLSRSFAAALGSPALRGLLELRSASSVETARRAVRSGGIGAAYVVPHGFEAAVRSGSRAEITVISGGGIDGDVAAAVASAFAARIEAARLAVLAALRSGAPSTGLASVAADAARAGIPIALADRGIARRPVSGATYFGPAMAMFFLFFVVGTGARSLVAERAEGTLRRILAAPTPPGAIVAGKAAAVFVLGLASMATVFVSMHLIFGVRWGDPVALGAVTVLIVLALMAVTALVQTAARTEEQAAAYGTATGIVLATLGGNFFPLFQMPVVIQRLSALTPNGWALRAFTDIAFDGATLGAIVPDLLAIALFVLVCGSIALVAARRITVE